MATITTTKLLLLVCVFALLPLAMEMMPLQPESAGTTCGVLILLVYTLWENYYFFYCKIAILRSRHMMHFGFIIKLVCCFGWLCGLSFALVPLSDTLTGSVTFPALGITCLANLAVFYTCILRGAPKLDISAKDLLSSAHKLKNINEFADRTTDQRERGGLTTCRESDQWEGLTTCTEFLGSCDVVMLSKERPNSSMLQFMEYMSNVHHVESISLQCLPLESAPLTVEICDCVGQFCRCPAGSCTCGRSCRCIVFTTMLARRITTMLASPMPGIVKELSDSLCLLPCQPCQRYGCHGCKQGVESDRLREGESQVEFPGESQGESQDESQSESQSEFPDEFEGESQVECPAAVCELLHMQSHSDFCICIPVRSASDDKWTNQLITLLELQENEGRISASSALKNYIAGSGECDAHEGYNLFWLIIVRTLTEVLINIALTFCFKVDGFSSALVARRAMKDYLPSGFSPIAFLTAARVKSNPNNSNVCQLLWFRGSRLSLRPLYLMMGCVNLICSISWIVLVALEGGANKWYHTHSMPPSEARIIVIMVAIGIALAMDLNTLHNRWPRVKHLTIWYRGFFPTVRNLLRYRGYFIMVIVLVLEIFCIVSGSVVLRILGPKVFGKWLYGALQSLVWLKWGTAYFFTNRSSLLIEGIGRREEKRKVDGRYIYASAFFLNAILAGVRAEWKFS